MTGRISSVQTFGTLDGPGVRYVLFMQGCPLRCGYCHNPETWNMEGGTEKSAEMVMDNILRYRNYFGADGGLTVSGGEPLMQAAFVRELFLLCKQAGIHTALDTSGCMWNSDTAALIDLTDLCLLDIKMTSDDDYRIYVGCGIDAPLRFLSELEKRAVSTWIRHVVAGGINDSDEDIFKLCGLIRGFKCVKKVELLPFRKLCEEKYKSLDIPFAFAGVPETDERRCRELTQKIDTIRN